MADYFAPYIRGVVPSQPIYVPVFGNVRPELVPVQLYQPRPACVYPPAYDVGHSATSLPFSNPQQSQYFRQPGMLVRSFSWEKAQSRNRQPSVPPARQEHTPRGNITQESGGVPDIPGPYWPHHRSIRKPCNYSSQNVYVPQLITADDEAEERRILKSYHSKNMQSNNKNDEPVLPQKKVNITIDDKGFSYRPFSDLSGSKSFDVTRHTDNDISSIPPSSPPSEKSSRSILQKNSSTPEQEKLTGNSLFITNSDAPVYSMDILKGLYWKIYQCYSPVQLITESDNRFSRLTKEIWQAYLINQQSIKEYITKLDIWKHLQLLLEVEKPESQYTLRLTGSTLSGLAMSGSDIDLCLKAEIRPGIPDRFNSIFHLKALMNLLKPIKEVSNIQLIEAKVPVLRFLIAREEHLWVDVNCNNIVGIANTQLLYAYTRCDWRFQPLFTAITKWSHYNNLHEPLKKTLPSYALTLLVIQFLQFGVTPPVLPCINKCFNNMDYVTASNLNQFDIMSLWTMKKGSDNRMGLGELLINFFDFYKDFDFAKHVVSVRSGKPTLRDSYRLLNPTANFKDNDLLIVEEPFILTNTTHAINCPVAFGKIVSAFAEASDMLKRSLTLAELF